MPIDWPTLFNWIVSGAISLIFGLIGGWIAYRFERKRDDIAWERKKQDDLRAALLKGVDNPALYIRRMEYPLLLRTRMLSIPSSSLAWLIQMGGQLHGKQFLLGQVTTIGRDPCNDIIIEDANIAGCHVKIKLEGKDFILYSLTTVPTRVNGEEVIRHVLADGDQVEIGELKFVFKMGLTSARSQSCAS